MRWRIAKTRSALVLTWAIGLMLAAASLVSAQSSVDVTLTVRIAPAGPGEIRGSKWEDLNGNGQWEQDESGLEGWTIYVDANGNGCFDEGEAWDITDSSGDYAIPDLAAGTYTVAEVPQAGWEQTYPAAGTHSIELAPGQVAEDINFGNSLVVHALTVQSTPITGVAIGSTTSHNGTTDYMLSVTHGTSVNLQVPATDPTGYKFVRWALADAPLPPQEKSVTFAMDADTTATAVYVARSARHYVKHDAAGANDGTSWEDAYVLLQSALTAAISGEEIWVADGTYVPGLARTDTFQLKSGVNVYGGFGGTETALEQRDWTTYVTILSGDINGDDDGFTNNSENTFHVVTGADNAVIDGFMITQGNADGTEDMDFKRGAGMFNDSASPIVINCNFVSNAALPTVNGGVGGGMFNRGGSPQLTNCVFVGNQADGGAGMYNQGSSPTLTSCTFDQNSSRYAGGMYNEYGSPTLTGCTFSANSCSDDHTCGGGIYNWAASPQVIGCTFVENVVVGNGGGVIDRSDSYPLYRDCTFQGNSAQAGGAVYESAPGTWEDCTFVGNSAHWGGAVYGGFQATGCLFVFNSSETLGGAIFSRSSSVLEATNCVFVGNYAEFEGGAAYCFDNAVASMTNCTIAANEAERKAGALVTASLSECTLTNCVVWGNTDPSGILYYNDNSTFVVRCSDLEGGVAAIVNANGGVVTDAGGNIDADPLFVDAGTGDYHLQAGSPCIDAADGSAAPTTDMDGNPRHDDPGMPNVGVGPPWADMGAYEFQGTTIWRTLTMEVSPCEGGTTTPAPGAHEYLDGTTVDLTATANPGYTFDHWIGDVADPEAAETTIAMNDDETVTAVFEPEIAVTLRFDFGTASSPVAADYTRVSETTSYTGALGHGWLSGTLASRDRGTPDDLTRDFCFSGDATFGVDLDAGSYDVTVTLGDATHEHDRMGVFLEGVQVDEVTTAAGAFATSIYSVDVTDGQLTLRLRNMGGSDANVTINALEIVSTGPPPAALTVEIAAEEMSENAGLAATTGRVTRSGDTTDALVVALASDDTTEATVPASVTILSGNAYADFDIDAVDDAAFDGDQTVTITATAAGYLDGTDTVVVTDDEVPAEPEGRYDFGTASSPVETDYVRVSHGDAYSAAAGYGWLSGAVDSRDRSIGTALTRDFCFSGDATFVSDVANGSYDVTVTLGDATHEHDRMGVYLEGVQVDEVTTAAGVFAANTYSVDVADGQLTLRLRNMGGSDANVTINALEIVSTGPPPMGLTVEIAADSIAENAGASATTGRVTRSGDTTDALVVTLASDDTSEATVPASVTILAGDSQADFDIDAVDDAEADGDQTVMITATAGGYLDGTDTVVVTDDEVPVEPEGCYDFGTASSPVESGYTRVAHNTVYSAAQGYGWLLGDVDSRDRSTGTALTRDLCFSGDATFVADVASGDYEATVTLGDATHGHDLMGVYLEGVQVDTVTTAAGAFATHTYSVHVGDGQLTLRLADLGGSDANVTIVALEIVSTGPAPEALTVQIAAETIPENAGPSATTGRVTRSGDTTDSLIVTLASDDPSEATVPSSVTILAGESYADFDIDAVDDAETDGDQTVTISASATGYLDGSDTVVVTDDEVPPEPVGRYDFGTASSPVEIDYTQVTHTTAYSGTLGHGWTAGTVDSRDRGTGTALTRDFCFSTDATFEADLAAGTYEVAVTLGDMKYGHDHMGVFLEGTLVDDVTTAKGESATGVYTVAVTDGGLTVRLHDLGGEDVNVTVVAIEITDVSGPGN